jgi:signal transduction histidine kinase
LLTINADNRIIEANLTFAQLLGHQRPQLIGQGLENLITPEDRTTLSHHLAQVWEPTSQAPGEWHCQLRLVPASGSEPIETRLESQLLPVNLPGEVAMIRISVSRITHQTDPLSDGQGEPPLINPPLQNEINEIESGETVNHPHPQQVAKRNMVGEMASSMAHEINQPLTAIASYTQSCLRLIRGDDEQQAQVPTLLEQINTQAQRAASIIKHLRNFITGGESHREAIDLPKLVRLTVSMMLNDLSHHHIKLNIKAAPSLPLIAADPIQIEQIILNLLRNASDAMNEVETDSRRLLISLDRLSQTHLSITVSDTGHGIRDDDSDKVSTPFFSTKENGMGLGLAICRAIVDDHGGQLSHQGNSHGGATFTFSLAINGKRSSTV